MAQPHVIVVSDLDGTLLDHETYSFDAARPALARLRQADVPLVLCTSKTRAEVESIRRSLDNEHPFIVENGGAVVIPLDYFSFDVYVDPTLSPVPMSGADGLAWWAIESFAH